MPIASQAADSDAVVLEVLRAGDGTPAGVRPGGRPPGRRRRRRLGRRGGAPTRSTPTSDGMDGASRERRAAQPEEIGRLAGLPASSDGDDVTGATSMDGDLAIDPGQGARASAGDWVDVSSRSR